MAIAVYAGVAVGIVIGAIAFFAMYMQCRHLRRKALGMAALWMYSLLCGLTTGAIVTIGGSTAAKVTALISPQMPGGTQVSSASMEAGPSPLLPIVSFSLLVWLIAILKILPKASPEHISMSEMQQSESVTNRIGYFLSITSILGVLLDVYFRVFSYYSSLDIMERRRPVVTQLATVLTIEQLQTELRTRLMMIYEHATPERADQTLQQLMPRQANPHNGERDEDYAIRLASALSRYITDAEFEEIISRYE